MPSNYQGLGRLQDSSNPSDRAGFPPSSPHRHSPRLTRRQTQAAEASHGCLLRRPAQCLGGGGGVGTLNVTQCCNGKDRTGAGGRGVRREGGASGSCVTH